MLEIVKPGININFIKLRRIAFTFSALVIGVGLLSLLMKGGLNYGIDFTGGLMVHVGFEDEISIGQVRSAVDDVGLGDISVQEFGAQGHEYLLRVPSGDSSVGGGRAATIKEALRDSLPGSGFEELRTEIVGPRVGKELRRRGILSVLFATLMMGAYIALRFQLRFGVGAGIALLHDVVVTIGALSLANVEIDLSVVAGLLTVVGYSVNDTVVVSDRIRENMKKFSRDDMGLLINTSINETLSRTVLTTGTSLLVLFALFFVGGGVIHGFAYTLIIGLSVGTYSSVFIASPVVEYMKGGAR
ncbi:MAG TPA: protein translocase subunit SecF [Deltaproteobacteria bacterium]|nr:protein translocase subunit SecF [Candidatus Binatota bacterium]HIL14323.1 protein translocase subunit SecF [Deltaproteobacteria bacterium]